MFLLELLAAMGGMTSPLPKKKASLKENLITCTIAIAVGCVVAFLSLHPSVQ